ncbi:MAG TPA: metallophosphoesterase [Myxococcaceae bacterium]|nr:metallophosphoesterase [Myxococcaceae bacterium]
MADPFPRRRRLVTFFAAASAVFGLLHVYPGLRLFSDTHLPAPWGALGWLLLALAGAAVPVGFFLIRTTGNRLSRGLFAFATFWLGGAGILLTATVGTDVLRLGADLIRGFPAGAARVHEARLQAAAIATLALLLTAWAVASARGRFQLRRVRVPLPRLGEGLDGLRIVQISDLHIGERKDVHFLRRVVERVNALVPDVVAITGDLVDGPVRALRDEVAPLAELRARYGVYYVTGNHEYYWGGPEWEAEVDRLGLTVLRNTHRVISRGGSELALGGVPDLQGARFHPEHACRPDLAFAGAPAGAPRVLLAHQPSAARTAAEAGVDLQLSGHTHGGQIFPFHLLVWLSQPVLSGLKRLFGIWVYTHRGTGTWGPKMRLLAAPEIAEITLTAA